MTKITLERDGELLHLTKHGESTIDEWRDVFRAILLWLGYPLSLVENAIGDDDVERN